MAGDVVYEEQLSSRRTQALFLALTLLCLLLLSWRLGTAGPGVLAWALVCLAVIFLFYTVNYRTMTISLTPLVLQLRFGIFAWKVPLENVADCALDQPPPLMAMGGAGIHFMFVRGRYRASLNFLEYPRVVVALRRPTGPVRDVSFSTRRPDEIVRLLRAAVAARDEAQRIARAG